MQITKGGLANHQSGLFHDKNAVNIEQIDEDDLKQHFVISSAIGSKKGFRKARNIWFIIES